MKLVGRRTAAAALTTVYGIPTPFSGPRYASAVSGGGATGSLSATVSFSGVGPGHDGPLVVVTPNPVGPLANSSVCPVGVSAVMCEGFMIQVRRLWVRPLKCVLLIISLACRLATARGTPQEQLPLPLLPPHLLF